AQAAIGSTPRTGRSAPSSASSPTNSVPSSTAGSSTPAAHSMPTAMGTSKAAPSLRRSAGARLTVIRRGGSLNPAVSSAPRMRTRPSRMPASASPTMAQQGRPTPTSTSTSMGAASIPITAADVTRTNMRLAHCERDASGRPRSARRAQGTRGREAAGRPRAGRLAARNLERQAGAEAAVERRLVDQRLAVVRVLRDRGAVLVLGVLQIGRRAVDDRRGAVVGVVVVDDQRGLLVEEVEQVDEALDEHLRAKRPPVADAPVELG